MNCASVQMRTNCEYTETRGFSFSDWLLKLRLRRQCVRNEIGNLSNHNGDGNESVTCTTVEVKNYK